MSKRILIVVAILFLAPYSADAKNLYVNGSSGDDSTTYAANDATHPWRSIGRAAWGSTSRGALNPGEAARAGDVVLVAAGTYTTTGTGQRYEIAYNPANSGSAGSPITFAAQGVVTLTYSSGAGPVIGTYGKHYITWRGFTINEVNAVSVPDTGPVVIVDSTGSIIEDCLITGVGDNGRQDNYTGVRIDSGTNITIRNNRIRDFLGYGRNSAGIMTYYSRRLTFENNEISNTGSGIYLKANFPTTDLVTIRYNLIYGIQTGGIDIHRHPAPSTGPILIYQNVIRNSAQGIKIHGFDSGATDARFMKAVNNTLVNNTTTGMHVLYPMVDNAGHMFWNNVVSGGSYSVYMEAPGSNLARTRIDFQHNMYNASAFADVGNSGYTLASWQSSFGQDALAPASTSQNPLFVNPGLNDFHLQAGSPARSGGVDILDLNANGSTSDAIPRGAYITGNEIIGRTAGGGGGTAPVQPTGLTITRP